MINIKKALITGVLAVSILAGALPAFAASDSHASCVGIDLSIEDPQGLVSGEVHQFLEFAKNLGIPLGTLVEESAKLHLESRTACGE